MKFMHEAYIVAGLRTAVTKAKRVDDVMVGNAVPEGDLGLQVGRIIAVRALGQHAPGVTVNRYFASGLETIAMATAKISAGMAEYNAEWFNFTFQRMRYHDKTFSQYQ
jgi:acetyl-CoA acyltransferase